MSLEQQIQETVALAKELSLSAFTKFSETGELPEQSKEEADRILAQHKWLCENFKKVKVNQPGVRTRMGWSAEAIAAMSKVFN